MSIMPLLATFHQYKQIFIHVCTVEAKLK